MCGIAISLKIDLSLELICLSNNYGRIIFVVSVPPWSVSNPELRCASESRRCICTSVIPKRKYPSLSLSSVLIYMRNLISLSHSNNRLLKIRVCAIKCDVRLP